MPESTTKPDPRRPDAPTMVEGPPEEEFWEKYNKRLEFPLSYVGTVLFHVVVGLFVYLYLEEKENREDRSSVNVGFMEIGGMDDFGAGSAGSGGREEPLIEKMNQDPTTAAVESLGNPKELPQIKEQTIKLIDPTGNLPITASNAISYKDLNEAIRNNLLGANRGAGKQPGKGTDFSPGSGPGGVGADSTLGRTMRWTLRFRVNSGHDYLKQLQTMGATILIPRPGTDQCVVIEDLANPQNRREVGAGELGRYAGLLKFADSRQDAVGGVAGALGLEFRPRTFFAVFSKEFENDLASKERGYQNRRAEQIEETVYKVTVSGGSFNVTVAEQKLRQ